MNRLGIAGALWLVAAGPPCRRGRRGTMTEAVGWRRRWSRVIIVPMPNPSPRVMYMTAAARIARVTL